MDTESIQVIETPAPEVIVPKQIHCALKEDTNCTFQCNSIEQMERHIEIKHRRKTQLQCTVCNIFFRNLDDLAKHMNFVHTNSQDVEEHEDTIKCNQCEKICQDREDLNNHIMKDHKTYKPCIKFAVDKCQETKCRFPHVKLKGKEEICYKCGHMCTSKTDLINHIKDNHGNEICHKFLSNQCGRSSAKCIFKHQTKDTSQQHQRGFQQGPNPPLHSPAAGMLNMSEHIQNKLQIQSPQATRPIQVNILEMLPQIVAQVLTILTQQAIQ